MTGTQAVFKGASPEVPVLVRSGAPSARGRFPIRVYVASLWVATAVLLVSLIAAGFPLSDQASWWPVLAFTALAAIVERQSIRLSDSLEISAAFLPLTFAAVVFGPMAGALVGAGALLGELPLWRRRATDAVDAPYLRWLVWTANRMLDGALAGLAAGVFFTLGLEPALQIGLATAVATMTIFAVDLGVTSVTLVVRRSGRPADVVRDAATVAAAGIPIYTAITGLLAYAYLEVTPLSAAFFFIPAMAAHRLFALSQSQQAALADLSEAFKRLESANLSFATALVATLDARDRYTAGHSAAVAEYARDIAGEMQLSDDLQQLAHLCGLVHDIGKIGLPPGLLEKPGALTPEERKQMEEHSAIGERILANVDDYTEIANIVRHHHERLDGKGYPDRLRGDEIPLLSRIICVADAYDAMTSDRPYRTAMPSDVARGRLDESAGSQFDREVVEAFQAVLGSADAPYRAGRRSRRSSARKESGNLALVR
jgi:putative nucleotidyltransferase with HDIG domain